MVRHRRALLALLVLAVIIFISVIPGKRGWFDAGVYYGTVRHWVHDGRPLYDYVRPESHYGFTYPPFAAVCMLPMLLFTWHQAVAVSVTLTVIASAALLYWLVDPIARRRGWDRRYTFAIAACMFAVLEPVRDTVSFGQVNLLLMALVCSDLWLMSTGRTARAGVGIGLAAAIKLTPAIFIVYLLVTRRWKPARTAIVTAVAATLLTANFAPTESLIFWTDALWDTNRIGVLAYVSNQSMQGVLSRLFPPTPGAVFWALAVLAAIVIWARRARQAGATGDDRAGFALTGVLSCLISPITWVHHLVWLIPALIALADSRRRRATELAAVLYLVLCSSLVWLWAVDYAGLDGFLFSNAYVWISLALLVLTPVGEPALELPRPRAVRTRRLPRSRPAASPHLVSRTADTRAPSPLRTGQ